MTDLRHGDCLELMKDIPSGSIDCVVTDPPYRVISGGTKSKWSSGWNTSVLSKNDGKIFEHNSIKLIDYIPEIYRVLKNDTHFYIMTNNLNLQETLNTCISYGFKFHNLLFWLKNTATANRWYMKNTEYILFFRKGKAKPINNMSSMQTLSFNNIVGNKIHPTEKPIKLFEKMITNSSKEGDVILDPFLGGGTTAIAAINTNRNSICIEKDDNYFKIGSERVQKHLELINKPSKIDLFNQI